MSMDLTGITNKNEYYTNHYFSTVFEENTRATISGWNAAARESEEIKTPWSLLRQNARQYYTAHEVYSELLPADKVEKVEELIQIKSEKENMICVFQYNSEASCC